MTFHSAYRHGFLRVAAAHLADRDRRPGRQRRVGAGGGRVSATTRASALVVFPELTLTGYSIEDVLLQDTLLDAVEAALLDVVAGVGGPAAGAGRRAPRCATGTGSTTARS